METVLEDFFLVDWAMNTRAGTPIKGTVERKKKAPLGRQAAMKLKKYRKFRREELLRKNLMKELSRSIEPLAKRLERLEHVAVSSSESKASVTTGDTVESVQSLEKIDSQIPKVDELIVVIE